MNGSANGTASNGSATAPTSTPQEIVQLNLQLKQATQFAKFHGDELIGDKRKASGTVAGWENSIDDFKRILKPQNLPAIGRVVSKLVTGGGLDLAAGAQLVGSMSNDSNRRAALIEAQVKSKYERMLHPPLTYLGDAFQYRTADGKFNSVLHPHLGQAGAPYAKTVPSITHPLGALPDPGDLFDRLMARQDGGRESVSGLSSMLIYHATIIIHDIFRTNEKDKNISDSSSYLDLSPLYGYTEKMQRQVRDNRYKLGLLKPDTFAEDRLLRQPPGVCIMLVMYNRYHNYAATQLRRINENGRFTVPAKFAGTKLIKVADNFVPPGKRTPQLKQLCDAYKKAWDKKMAEGYDIDDKSYQEAIDLEAFIAANGVGLSERATYEAEYDAAWNKLDDDLFNTARLITCGIYIQISIHDYLRALMGFHQFDTNFTLDPRIAMTDHKEVTRGIGNQVTVEFNLLYRFHCAISLKDEKYTEDFMKEMLSHTEHFKNKEPVDLDMPSFMGFMKEYREYTEVEKKKHKKKVWEQTFGLETEGENHFPRHPITGLFDDQKMIDALTKAMDDPISNFGPRNIPKSLKAVEIMGILQARKWEIGTLNDFREFFGMHRHDTFESITGNVDVQDALRDLYEHPDKVELYPGVFCESDAKMGMDPGPSDVDSALWAAIFSDAITLVRSDRFYTVDWNTNSLTSWGMKEVTPDNDICKTSVFHRLLQRAFPGWYEYDSVRFFHPFYTAQQNANYADQQGYGKDFKFTKAKPKESVNEYAENPRFDITPSNPKRPQKPVYLSDYESIKTVLSTHSEKFVHPALSELKNLPSQFGQIMKSTPVSRKDQSEVHEDPEAIMTYLMSLTRDIVKRESIVMDRKKGVYQLDMTRDLAIPVTTRYVADFLGIGHLIKGDKNLKAPYTENEIYRHITNCQVFLSYNADETKLLKRRLAFRTSMKFLYELAQSGNILEANKWAATRWLLNIGHKERNVVTALGFQVAQNIIAENPDSEKAAAIFLLVALDLAYNSVTAFTSVLNTVISELYDGPSKTEKPASQSYLWKQILDNVFQEGKEEENRKQLSALILKIQLASVKLPIIRKARGNGADVIVKDTRGNVLVNAKDGQLIICDVNQAQSTSEHPFANIEEYLDLQMSFTHKFAHHHPKHLGLLAITALVKTVAQMRNVRRGHDAQGRLKKVKLDASPEGYSNFMAPMRLKKIAHDADNTTGKEGNIYNPKILRPQTETYLTPEWDEMIPYPTTWKLRFEGFGRSKYDWTAVPVLGQVKLPDFFPPFYQPQGPSHHGGTFAGPQCVCERPDATCDCKPVPKDDSDDEDEFEARDANGAKKVAYPSDYLKQTSGGCGAPST